MNSQKKILTIPGGEGSLQPIEPRKNILDGSLKTSMGTKDDLNIVYFTVLVGSEVPEVKCWPKFASDCPETFTLEGVTNNEGKPSIQLGSKLKCRYEGRFKITVPVMQ